MKRNMKHGRKRGRRLAIRQARETERNRRKLPDYPWASEDNNHWQSLWVRST